MNHEINNNEPQTNYTESTVSNITFYFQVVKVSIDAPIVIFFELNLSVNDEHILTCISNSSCIQMEVMLLFIVYSKVVNNEKVMEIHKCLQDTMVCDATINHTSHIS